MWLAVKLNTPQANPGDRIWSPALCRRNIAQSGHIDRFGLEKLRGLLLFALVRSNDDGRLIFDEFLSFARDFRLFGRSFVCRNPGAVVKERAPSRA